MLEFNVAVYLRFRFEKFMRMTEKSVESQPAGL